MTEDIPNTSPQPEAKKKVRLKSPLIYKILLAYILLIGAYFRFVGIEWGDFQYLHPDERFLVMVGANIQPISADPEVLGRPPNTTDNPYRATFGSAYSDCQAWGGYFDSSCSPLNPNNRGHNFYVYGTLPMFIVRYMVQWIYGYSGLNEMTIVGRWLSASVDLLSVILVYAIAASLFKKQVGLLAAAFFAFTVLNIQQSHFFTMDTFTNFFTLLAVYFAVRVSLVPGEAKIKPSTHDNGTESLSTHAGDENQPQSTVSRVAALTRHPSFGLSIAFGIALGCAVSSKLNAAPVAFVLPVAFGLLIMRQPPRERSRWVMNAVLYLGLAALVSILVFRIFQPYAFTGPGFFGLRPNPWWVATIKEQRGQAAGDIDFPPSLQWARRPIWFSALNMLEWGMGIPLGILAGLGFLWAGWRLIKGDWQQHAVLWLWGGFYFVWQSLQFNPTMRYQLPTYPILIIYAGWGIMQLWDYKKRRQTQAGAEIIEHRSPVDKRARTLSLLAGGLVLTATFAWALAFSLIYSRPITRVAASRWVYQNLPGPVSLPIQTGEGLVTQPLSIPYGTTVQQGYPFQMIFTANASGTLNTMQLAHITSVQAPPSVSLITSLSTQPDGGDSLMASVVSVPTSAPNAPSTGGHQLKFGRPVTVEAGQTYYLRLGLIGSSQVLNACGPVVFNLQTSIETITQTIAGPDPCMIDLGTSYILPITPEQSGTLDAVTLSQLADQTLPSGAQTLTLTVGPTGDEQVVATATITSEFTPGADGRGAGYTPSFNRPITLEKGKNYSLSMALENGNGAVSIQGTALANEGEWDDGLPLRVDGYDAFGGIYTPGLNFNMYTDDNPDKLERFISIYDQAEYILISSSRQWGSLPRIPERFPMTSLHYRHLLGCPDEQTIPWCYSVAQPGMFHGDMGFELVQVFQSDPKIGRLQVNDQFAEEAFTVYDHPKVLIFRKTSDYNSEKARQVLSQANFSEIVRITPKKAASHLANLKLPSERLVEETAGGTWSKLFSWESLQNRFQVLGVILWYLSLSLLGLLVYPLLRIALPGLPDHGYPLARTTGMLILAYLTWVAGSANIPVSRLTISLVVLLMAAGGGYLAYQQRNELRSEWQSKRTYFLIIEGLVLAFFLAFLFVRLGNPDLWHPWKGGEKPMDFSYLNAVLKSTNYPPYDPWFAGGEMNYYYWGFVFVGVLVKWLGIVPSFAYNLIIPTLFSMVAMGAFSIAYNLSQASHLPGGVHPVEASPEEAGTAPPSTWRPYQVGLASALGMAVLGNLGTLRMIAKGWEQLGVPGGLTESTGFLARLAGLFSGLYQVMFQGAKMPYNLGDWYWIPSRAIPAPADVEPITEFPLFSFLYGDPHAHVIAMAIAMLALTWCVAILMGKARWRSAWAGSLSILLGGLAIGALYPTNLSDIYTYLPVGMAALGYAIYRYASIDRLSWLPYLSSQVKRMILAVLGVLFLVIAAYGLYLPYRLWYAQGYSTVIPWFGTHTPFWSYLTHWGLFLFVIISWMVWETRQWMADTPLVSLRKLEKYSGLILLVLVVLLLTCLLLSIKLPGIENISYLSKIPIGRGAGMVWFILPLAAWAGVLLLRPGMPDSKRLVLFWVGTGLLITLMVEVVVVRGDIGRMNTVFKFYLHSWTLFALSAAAALGWLIEPVRRWLPGWRVSWKLVFIFLVFSAALFTFLGSTAKIKDRWVTSAPHTLDGMSYMQHATYSENYPNVSESTPVEQRGIDMDLSQDYRLIRWMQANIQGTPVIVEATSRNLYRWYSRFTIYTGLPGVVGWEWHEQQQRAINPPEWVTKRVTDIDLFYTTVDTDYTKQFLSLYGVRYIVVGQLEQVTYPGPGLDKFPAFNGNLWKEVYRDQSTVLYEVIK